MERFLAFGVNGTSNFDTDIDIRLVLSSGVGNGERCNMKSKFMFCKMKAMARSRVAKSINRRRSLPSTPARCLEAMIRQEEEQGAEDKGEWRRAEWVGFGLSSQAATQPVKLSARLEIFHCRL